jgi:chromosome segregation ATPase
MALSQKELKSQYKELKEKLAEANAEVKRVQLEMQILTTRCKHPNKYQYSAMGELGWNCPDCPYQT